MPSLKKTLTTLSYIGGFVLLGIGIWSKLTQENVSLTVLSLSCGIILLFLPLIFWTYRDGEGIQADF